MKVREIAFKDLKKKGSIEVEIFSESDSYAWDEFVWSSNNGTIFHSRQFLNYHPKNLFRDASLIFKKEKKWLSVFPAAMKEQDGEQILISHPGSSMAGPVYNSFLSFKDSHSIVESLVEFAKKESIAEILVTLPPAVYHLRPSNYIDFALLESGFKYLKREVSSVIPLDFAEEDTLLVFSPESRRAARKAMKKGVEIQESDDLTTFYKILNKNLKMRHNVQPTHSLDELLILKQKFPESIKLLTASVDGEMIAGIFIFICNSKVALAFYITHREDMQEYRPVNLLFYELIRWAIRQRLAFLDFGIFTVNMKPNWGLARFKESFGAQGVFRDTFVKKL